jgi:hypothetical protein
MPKSNGTPSSHKQTSDDDTPIVVEATLDNGQTVTGDVLLSIFSRIASYLHPWKLCNKSTLATLGGGMGTRVLVRRRAVEALGRQWLLYGRHDRHDRQYICGRVRPIQRGSVLVLCLFHGTDTRQPTNR